MTEFKIEDVENIFWSDFLPEYNASDADCTTFQRLPHLTETPFLGQSIATNNPTIEHVPGWMTQNFQNGGNFQISAESGDAQSGHGGNPVFSCELSPAPSSTGSYFGFEERVERDDKFDKIISSLGITELQLQKFSVKELNRFLKSNGLSKEQQQRIKNRRRTLKNRGYAQNCRVKRINHKKTLEIENEELRKELDHLKADLKKATRERNSYKEKLVQVASFLKQRQKVA